ncbi:MAG: hypothetical protein KY445_04590 [Armatimonadetes bacterium]|nr:hypothetical protein [Armatimonadota bacterium]
MTLVLELPREIEEKLDELAREKSVTREEIALECLRAIPAQQPRRQLKSWGIAAHVKGFSSENIHRARREEVARELGERE